MELVIGGDVYLGGSLGDELQNRKLEVWGDSLPLIANSDFRIVNLESPLTISSIPIEKSGPNIKADPEQIDILKQANIDIVTLANNHIMDYGSPGLVETFEVLDQYDIDYVGAGADLNAAKETLYKEINGIKIGIINIAENEWASATKANCGAHPMNVIANTKSISEAKKNADKVILIIHGGHELYSYPSPRMVEQYRFYADQGADVIIGHHTHCPSGYEIYNDTPIFYSIGNLIFDSETSFKPWYSGMFVKLKIGNEINFEIIPYNQFKNEPHISILKGDQKLDFLDKLKSINAVIADENKLEEKWKEFVDLQYLNMILILSSKKNFVFRVLKKLNVLERFLKKKDVLTLYNLIRCEAHRDLSIGVLEKLKQRL
jgi:poly-gamma-glutamate synthesis protein (capsule biosynthesis protein)